MAKSDSSKTKTKTSFMKNPTKPTNEFTKSKRKPSGTGGLGNSNYRGGIRKMAASRVANVLRGSVKKDK